MRHFLATAHLALATLLALGLSPNASAQLLGSAITYQGQLTESNQNTSLAIGSDGLPVISFYDRANKSAMSSPAVAAVPAAARLRPAAASAKVMPPRYNHPVAVRLPSQAAFGRALCHPRRRPNSFSVTALMRLSAAA